MRKSNRRRKIHSVAAAEQLEVRRNLSALSISDVVYQPGTHEIYGEVEHENHIDVVVDYGDSSTNAYEGGFSLIAPNTTPGTYTITLTASGLNLETGQTDTGDAFEFTYTVNAEASSFEDLVYHNGFVEGRLVDENDAPKPLTDITLSLSSTNKNDDIFGETDYSGDFEMYVGVVGPGTYTYYLRDYEIEGVWHEFTFTVDPPPPGGSGSGENSGAAGFSDSTSNEEETDLLFAGGFV